MSLNPKVILLDKVFNDGFQMEAFASDAKDLFNERIRIAGAISTAIGKSLKGEFDIDQMMDYIEQAAPEHIDDYVDLVTEQLQENCPWLFEV